MPPKAAIAHHLIRAWAEQRLSAAPTTEQEHHDPTHRRVPTEASAGSPAEERHSWDAQLLAAIPGVEKFEQLRQISPKNDYRFGFSMEFADQAAYSSYNDHPDHVAFVRDRWMPEVEAFLEIDYMPLG